MFPRILALVTTLLCSAIAFAQAGVAIEITGDVYLLKNGSRQYQKMATGGQVNHADLIAAERGNAVIKLTDGAFLEVKPSSKVYIESYAYTNNPKTDIFAVRLMQGILRTVTGAIGHANGNRHRISTVTATIGVRGSDGIVGVDDTGITMMSVSDGKFIIQNPHGNALVDKGFSATADSTRAPVVTPVIPEWLTQRVGTTEATRNLNLIDKAFMEINQIQQNRILGTQQFNSINKALGN